MNAPASTAVSLKDLGYLTEEEAARLYRREPLTLRNWRCRGIGPAYTKVGNLIAYPIEAIKRDLEARTIKPSSAPTLIDGQHK